MFLYCFIFVPFYVNYFNFITIRTNIFLFFCHKFCHKFVLNKFFMYNVIIKVKKRLKMNFGIESETLEFKKNTNEINEAMKSICAMLNKHGKGTLYFGIGDDGLVYDQKININTLRDICRKIYENIEPVISPIIEKKIVDNKQIIEVTFCGNDAPYSVEGIYYIRNDDEDKILSPNQLRQLFEFNKNKSWDSELSDYEIDDIDLETFQKFYKKAIKSKKLNEIEFNAENILNKLSLMKNEKLTNAAHYLFSHREPIVLKMAVFATDQKLTFLDINRISGNIFQLIEKANEYVKSKINWKAEFVDIERIDIPEIPIDSLKEIIINSFAHAKYESAIEHEINIHPSNIKIYNPGQFPIEYTPEDFAYKNIESIIRNPLILKMINLVDEAKICNNGFKRVYEECEKTNAKITYQKGNYGFAFIFLRENKSLISKDEEFKEYWLPDSAYYVYMALKNNPKETAGSLAKKIKKSSRTIQRILDLLKDKGYIARIGKTRGYWKILK
ncbi:ATP-dependent DNA helicase [Mycoplasmopsis fermentans M64]|nr:ATP-dependent DNA helicase [Mycoplasmopsis fermentans M64]